MLGGKSSCRVSLRSRAQSPGPTENSRAQLGAKIYSLALLQRQENHLGAHSTGGTETLPNKMRGVGSSSLTSTWVPCCVLTLMYTYHKIQFKKKKTLGS